VVHHVAFASQGFAGMKQRLESKGWNSTRDRFRGGDLWQIFVDDPNGVMIELITRPPRSRAERQRPSSAWMTSGAGSLLSGPLYGRIRT